jgi:hypothetical protein
MMDNLVLGLIFSLASFIWYKIGHRAGERDARRDARESNRRYQESINAWKGEK